jgi:16S rRNA (cytidine1402-2'-O)-methyltransferase
LSAKTERHGESRRKEGQLYVVATPIGNLEDVTLRALAVLAQSDLIAAEDTRTTAILLDHHKIRSKLVPLHEHNERRASQAILAALRDGGQVSLVSDAGTPGISDPGAIVVGLAHEAGFRVTPIPGPNAAVAAMSVSGLQQSGFLFRGFLPPKATARREAIELLRDLPWPVVLYEAPHRVVECVEDLAAILGKSRELVIARELTKLFEEIHRCRLGDAAAWLGADANRGKGEFVLVVAAAQNVSDSTEDAEAERVLKIALESLPLAQAVRLTCAVTGAKRNDVYPRALQLTGKHKA